MVPYQFSGPLLQDTGSSLVAVPPCHTSGNACIAAVSWRYHQYPLSHLKRREPWSTVENRASLRDPGTVEPVRAAASSGEPSLARERTGDGLDRDHARGQVQLLPMCPRVFCERPQEIDGGQFGRRTGA